MKCASLKWNEQVARPLITPSIPRSPHHTASPYSPTTLHPTPPQTNTIHTAHPVFAHLARAWRRKQSDPFQTKWVASFPGHTPTFPWNEQSDSKWNEINTAWLEINGPATCSFHFKLAHFISFHFISFHFKWNEMKNDSSGRHSGEFRRIPENSVEFRRIPENSGEFRDEPGPYHIHNH